MYRMINGTLVVGWWRGAQAFQASQMILMDRVHHMAVMLMAVLIGVTMAMVEVFINMTCLLCPAVMRMLISKMVNMHVHMQVQVVIHMQVVKARRVKKARSRSAQRRVTRLCITKRHLLHLQMMIMMMQTCTKITICMHATS